MAINVNSLSNYTKTNEEMLVAKSMFSGRTAKELSKLTGVKSSIQVPILTQDVFLQVERQHGSNPGGEWRTGE